MKKYSLCSVLFLFEIFTLFADSPAKNLYGYAETEGYCIVEGQRMHYWLYSTSDGETSQLIRAFVSYVENLGWTVDYDSFEEIWFNEELAESVKRMMIAKNADVSMTIVEYNKSKGALIVNDCLVNENHQRVYDIFRTRIYPLLK
jgi:hypothetical protein